MLDLLLVEDDIDIAASLGDALEAAGHKVTLTTDQPSAQALLRRSQPFDALLLDLGLPRGDGIALLQRLRRDGVQTPVLVMTAAAELADKLAAFAAGADDYLVKPCLPEEIVARLRALVRRAPRAAGQVHAVGRLSVHPDRHVATVDGRELELPPAAFQVLLALVRASPAVLGNAALLQAIGAAGEQEGSLVRTHVWAVRRALEPHGLKDWLVTVHGAGYRLRQP